MYREHTRLSHLRFPIYTAHSAPWGATVALNDTTMQSSTLSKQHKVIPQHDEWKITDGSFDAKVRISRLNVVYVQKDNKHQVKDIENIDVSQSSSAILPPIHPLGHRIPLPPGSTHTVIFPRTILLFADPPTFFTNASPIVANEASNSFADLAPQFAFFATASLPGKARYSTSWAS